MDEIEYRFVKIDPPAGDSRILEGTVIRYGEIGVGDYGPERFTPGSLEVNPDIILNVQHDRGRPIARTPDTLQLVDSAEALTLRADIPETREGSDALVSVRKNILQGLSLEFRQAKFTMQGGIRTITSALVSGVGLVDRGSFEGSKVETRAIGGAGISFSIKYNSKLQCECCPTSDEVLFEPGAFDEALKAGKEVLAVNGNFKGAIASRRRGTLTTELSDEGLDVQTSIADSTAGRDLIEMGKEMEILGRPIIDYKKSDTVVVDGITHIKRAHLRGFLLGASDSNEGWDPVQFISKPEKRMMTCDARGSPVWR